MTHQTQPEETGRTSSRHQRPPWALVVVFGITLVIGACTGGTTGDSPATTAAPSTVVEQTTPPESTTSTTEMLVAATVGTTIAASTPSSTVGTPRTYLTDGWRGAYDHKYAYQSVGYSCRGDPISGCDTDLVMKLDGMWMGKDEGSTTADFIDIMMKPQPGSEWTITHYLGSADDPNFAGTGWGVRVIQLDSPPEGFDMGGEAWIELTVSSLTATEFAARPTKTPNPATAEGSWIKVAAPTHDDPIAIRAPLDATNVIEELVLVETTDDMTQWIIALANDQVYHHSSLYRGFSGGNALNIRINGGGTS